MKRSSTFCVASILYVIFVNNLAALATTINQTPEALVKKFKTFERCVAHLELARAKSFQSDFMKSPDWKAAVIDGKYHSTSLISQPSPKVAQFQIQTGDDHAGKHADGTIRGLATRSNQRQICRGKKLFVSGGGAHLEIFQKAED